MKVDRAAVQEIYQAELQFQKFGAIMRTLHRLKQRNINCSYATLRSIVSGKQDAYRARRTDSRFAAAPITNRVVRLPRIDTPALSEKRTIYPATMMRDLDKIALLKSGKNSSKIGGTILKGKWKGMPVYTLTLEERATCPTSCAHWRSCFGNAMQFAQRIDHTSPIFEKKLVAEVCALADKYPGGFVVRLHVLGDFFSVRYVQLWRALIETVPALRVFGYTARYDGKRDPIARELLPLVQEHWERFAVRFSDAPAEECCTVSLEHPIQKPDHAVICPQQLGQTESCATCAFCWQSRRAVAFLEH